MPILEARFYINESSDMHIIIYVINIGNSQVTNALIIIINKTRVRY